MAKHLFSILMHLSPEERRAAVVVLSTLTLLVEDGYQGINKDNKVGDIDFYGFCYDAILSASLSLRMLVLSGNAPDFKEGEESFYFTPRADLLDSEQLLTTIETQLKNLANVSQGAEKKQ